MIENRHANESPMPPTSDYRPSIRHGDLGPEFFDVVNAVDFRDISCATAINGGPVVSGLRA